MMMMIAFFRHQSSSSLSPARLTAFLGQKKRRRREALTSGADGRLSEEERCMIMS